MKKFSLILALLLSVSTAAFAQSRPTVNAKDVNATGNITLGGTINGHTVPGSNIVGTTDTQTLTNKTMTSPVLNTPTANNPTLSGNVALTPGSSGFLAWKNASGLLTTLPLSYDGGSTLDMTTSSALLPNFQLTNTTNDDRAPYLTQRKSRGGSSVLHNDQVLNILGKPWTGSAYQQNHSDISFYVDGNVTGGKVGSKIFINTDSGNDTLGQWWNLDRWAHIGINQETAPTAVGCGVSPNIRAGSSDAYGAVTVGTTAGGACTIVFANAYRAKPFCTVTPSVQQASFSYTPATNAIVIALPANQFPEITWHCVDSSNPG